MIRKTVDIRCARCNGNMKVYAEDKYKMMYVCRECIEKELNNLKADIRQLEQGWKALNDRIDRLPEEEKR